MNVTPLDGVICHPDRIELFIPNSAGNRLILAQLFPEILDRWTDWLQLAWQHNSIRSSG